jgi:hypothetical protein
MLRSVLCAAVSRKPPFATARVLPDSVAASPAGGRLTRR